ncbi:MAG: hypothetical protein JWP18_1663 [Solirubrobacterales bacterium]|nr:hypothetical protein [Solirubrobacterales bacterium]
MPDIRLGELSDDSIVAGVDVLVRHGALLLGGVPRPTSARDRQAFARLADGRMDFVGGLPLARKVLMLLALDPSAAAGPAGSGRTWRCSRRAQS